MKNVYISMDGEFSGLDQTKNELISAGFVDCYDEKKQFYIEIKPTKEMDPEATKIHGLQKEYLLKNGLDKKDAAIKIRDWVKSLKADQVIFVGYPVTSDWVFLDLLFKESGIENPFYYEPIDIHTLGVALLGFEPGFSHSKLRETLKLKKQTSKHNALADAIHQAQEFVGLMEIAKSQRSFEVEEP